MDNELPNDAPRRWRKLIDKHPGCNRQFLYGVYFPQTDLNVTEMARPDTGVPKDVEWLDPLNDYMKRVLGIPDTKESSVTREVHGHRSDKCNEGIHIEALDQPGSGGANHSYRLSWQRKSPGEPMESVVLSFQNGGVEEVGNNGVTNESLLAVVLDRLRSFQEGPFACEENRKAVEAICRALDALDERTHNRKLHGVKGTQQP